MMRFYYTTIVCMFSLTALFGQNRTITGKVTDSSDQAPVSGVIVQLLNPQGKVLAYTLTLPNGSFSLNGDPASSETVLLFKSLGYREQTIPATEIKSPLEIVLEAEPIQLRDVVIKAPNILQKGDTLVYNVKQYADAQDRTIADVLKKMPGVEVAESGQVKYNGEPINKFYIEGSDFLEGRYGIATNNISHRDVKSVEIMENHQPVRALDGIEFSEQAGLNIRLQEDAKLRWVGVANGGTGFSPLLYDASLFAMHIAGKRQDMETIKFNNTGWNPASQNTRFTYDKLFSSTYSRDLLPDYISVGNLSTPLDEKRTRFNRSVFFNTTHSVKLSSDYDLRTNLTYEGDKLDFARKAHTDYFDPSITPLIESENILNRTHKLSGQVILQVNKPKYYLKDNLAVDLGWDKTASDISGSYLLGQKAETPVFNLSNDLQLTKRIENRVVTASSHNQISRKPHSLLTDDNEKQYNQAVTASAFQSITEASYGWIFGQWQIRGRAGLNVDYSSLESELTGIPMDSYPVENDSRLFSLNASVRPEIVYENKRLWVNPYATINYYDYRFNDRQAEDHTSKDYLIFSPGLSARYKFTARLDVLANLRYAIAPPSNNLFYRGVIMNNYRYLSAGYPLFDTGKERSAGLSLRYRNPISSVFANAGLRYERNNAATIKNQLFTGDQIILTYQPNATRSDRFSADGGVSKGLASGKINVGMDVGYTQVKTETMRNSLAVPYQLSVFSVVPKIKGTFAKWFSVNYMLLFAQNKMKVGEKNDISSYNNLRQTLNFSFFPTKRLQFNVGGEDYYSGFNDHTSNHLLLVDAGAKWKISDRIDISLSATNLLNERNYRYSNYGTLSETINEYRIRPRNILLSAQVSF